MSKKHVREDEMDHNESKVKESCCKTSKTEKTQKECCN